MLLSTAAHLRGLRWQRDARDLQKQTQPDHVVPGVLSKTHDANRRPYFRLTKQIFGRADGQDSRALQSALRNYKRDNGTKPILQAVDPSWRGLGVTNSLQPQLFVARKLVPAGQGDGKQTAMGLPGDYETAVRAAAIAIQGVLNSLVLIANPGPGGDESAGGTPHKGLIGGSGAEDGILVLPIRFLEIEWLNKNLEVLSPGRVPDQTLADFNAALAADPTASAAGLRARVGPAGGANPLQLISAKAIFLKGSHQPSPAPGDHRLIIDPVGSGGGVGGASHDIAAVQAALRLIPQATGSAGDNAPFWPGTIDGRGGAALPQAIAEFHRQVGLGERPTVAPKSAGEAELQKYLPAGYEKLCGLKGSDLAIIRTAAAEQPDKVPMPEAAALSAPVQANAQLMRELGRLVDIVWDRSGVGLKISGISQSPAGEAIFTLDLDGVRFLDSAAALLDDGKVPAGFYDYLHDLLKEELKSLSAIRWHDSGQSAVPQVISRDAITAATVVAAEKITDPTQLFQGDPAAVPAGHHLLEATIQGKRATGKPHDIAALQAALKLISRPDTGGPFFTGDIDGKGTDNLALALKAFQVASLLSVTGQVLQGDETEAHLIGRLPSGYRRLRGLPHSNVAIVGSETRPTLKAEISPAMRKLLTLPQQNSLDYYHQALVKKSGLSFRVTKIDGNTGLKGSLVLGLPSGIHALEPLSARLLPNTSTPASYYDYLRRITLDVSGFRLKQGNPPILASNDVLSYGYQQFKVEAKDQAIYLVRLNEYLEQKLNVNLAGIAGLTEATAEEIFTRQLPQIVEDIGIQGRTAFVVAADEVSLMIVGAPYQTFKPTFNRFLDVAARTIRFTWAGVVAHGQRHTGSYLDVILSAGIASLQAAFSDRKTSDIIREAEWALVKGLLTYAGAKVVLAVVGNVFSITPMQGKVPLALASLAVSFGLERADNAFGGRDTYVENMNKVLKAFEDQGSPASGLIVVEDGSSW